MTTRLSILAIALLALCSCRNDFTLEGDYQDIPLAFGFLNADDDRHFVRVEKAFLQSGGNAETNAGIADSIYYGADDATVVLENVTTGNSTELERVNGEDFDLDRDDGVFATSPNVLYSVRDEDLRLDGGDEVRLILQRPGQTDATATTRMLGDIEITRPGSTIRIDNYDRPVLFNWSKEAGAEIYDITILFNIRELFPSDPDRNRLVTLEWPVNAAFVPDGTQSSPNNVRFDVSSEAFYQFIGANLEPENNVVRRFQDFAVRVSAAGREVVDRRTLESANSGITSSQTLPRYTNIDGGLGIFTSFTSSLKEEILLDGNSLDSLRDGIYTRELGFR